MKKLISTTMAFLTAITMTTGAAGITSAYAQENNAALTEQQSGSDFVEGDFEGGASFKCYKNGLLRISGGSFTADDFYKIVKENNPKYLMLICTDISGDENQVSKWFKQVTSGELSIEAVAVVKNGDDKMLDKYESMISALSDSAENNGTKVSDTDLRYEYKVFFYDRSTAEFSGPDGVICENCHYVNMREMKAYPNNKGIIAAENAPSYNEEEVLETQIGEVVVLAKSADLLGDSNGDNELNVRDCAVIAQALANGKGTDLPDSADYNKDGNKNVRDAAEIARELASAK